MSLAEVLEVLGFHIGLSGLPAAEQDAEPFEGQGADSRVEFVAFRAEHRVIRLGPAGRLQGAAGELVKGLS